MSGRDGIASSSVLAALWAPLGDDRVNLAWRLVGFAMCQVVTGDTLWPRLAGTFLIVVGPRAISLLFASCASALLLKSLLTYPISAHRSPGEEHLIFFALPLLAVILQWSARRQPRKAAESAHLALFRGGAALLMFFVGFHKLNADFFHERVSCNRALGTLLDQAWALPLAEWHVLPPPGVVVGAELTSALLLFAMPRLGLLLVMLLLTPIALFGPTSLVSTVLALAVAGLRPDDLQFNRENLIGEGLRALPLVLAAVGLVIFFYEGASVVRFVAFVAVVSTLLCVVVRSLQRDASGPSWRFVLGHAAPMRTALVAFLLLGLLNGFSPYLGLKSKMSLAMFSNLRADQDRWNHFLVPERVFLRAHDPFIRLENIEFILPVGMRPEGRFPNRGREHLYPSLLTPESLRYRVGVLRTRKIDANLQLTYAGAPRTFSRVAENEEFAEWLDALPPEKLFQRSLRLSEPQICVH